ncbi:MAG: serine/threonine protein kinase [Halobacteriovoraceae bacterium]|nr:serine/threonine protein kinase [Halobacteriovoraceae bacterium]MCB9095539.1 serine/threonine protein kinase [Halobacteriovoraceae bacterium]
MIKDHFDSVKRNGNLVVNNTSYVWGLKETQYFYQLTPEIILDTLQNLDLEVTGRCLSLNSMENRVYEIEIANHQNFSELVNPAVVAKFYRPGRWSEEQIREEHEFLFDLVESEIPVIPPLKFEGESLFKLEEMAIYYAIFPKKGGRAPDELKTEQLEILGRTLARLHNVGATKSAKNRVTISPESYGLQNLKFLKESRSIPAHLENAYSDVVEEICALSEPLFKNISFLRIHGDCHLGNVISRESEGMFLIDFDDMLMGPAVQDIWLLTPGNDSFALSDRAILLESYQTMRNFDPKELKLIEPLRALRYIHFSAWIAKRWSDPAFQKAFPHFGEPQYWDIQLQDLRNQREMI